MAKQSTTARQNPRSKRTKKQQDEPATSQNGNDASSYEQELAEYLQERIKPGLNRGSIPLLARSIAKEIARRQASQGGDDSDGSNNGVTEAEADDGNAEAEADEDYVDEAEDDYTEAEADDEEPEGEADEDFDEEEPEAEADDEEPEGEADEDFDDEEPEAEADDEEPEAETDDDYDDDEADDEPQAEAGDEEADGNGSSDFETDMREIQAELGDDWILRFSVQGDESWLTAEKDDGSQRVESSTASVLSEVVGLLNENG